MPSLAPGGKRVAVDLSRTSDRLANKVLLRDSAIQVPTSPAVMPCPVPRFTSIAAFYNRAINNEDLREKKFPCPD